MSAHTATTPAHDKGMAEKFLAGLDPTASRFTFQLFSDGASRRAEIFHGTLDELWPKVQALNTPKRGVGVFVTIGETDFKGRSTKNVLRPRALFADADNDTQITHCMEAIKECGATPSMIVGSGRGLHFYYVCADIPRDQFSALQTSLIEKLRTDPAVKDLPRVMRLPGTLHLKNPSKPRLVKLYPTEDPVRRWTLSDLVAKLGLSPATTASNPAQLNSANTQSKDGFGSADMPPLDREPIIKNCPFFLDALKNGGVDHSQGLWNLTVLACTFLQDGEKLAHMLGNKHVGYTPNGTKALWDRKVSEKNQKGLGWPSCAAIQTQGCKLCATCKHLGKIKSPLNLAHQQQTQPAEPSFVDPYAEFGGPEFPLDVLPPTLARFVDAEHRAMGADPSAIAMAVLTTVAGAINGETRVRAGEGWWERPILWTALVGQPSTMKSPIIDKAMKPLSRIDHERAKRWKQEYAIWQQSQK